MERRPTAAGEATESCSGPLTAEEFVEGGGDAFEQAGHVGFLARSAGRREARVLVAARQHEAQRALAKDGKERREAGQLATRARRPCAREAREAHDAPAAQTPESEDRGRDLPPMGRGAAQLPRDALTP